MPCRFKAGSDCLGTARAYRVHFCVANIRLEQSSHQFRDLEEVSSERARAHVQVFGGRKKTITRKYRNMKFRQ